MIKRNRLIRLAQELIAIDSQNPGSDESRIAAYVAGFFRKLGVRVRTLEYKPRRTNVLAYLGPPGARTLLITPHLDTVPAGGSWTIDPFAGVIRRDRLYGLGATDCKVNLACAMEAMRSLIEDGARLPYQLVFAATADEETGSDLGLVSLLKDGTLRPDYALVLDSDDRSIVVAQKGLLQLRIRIKGRRAHGAYPWEGDNAIDRAAAVLSDIKKCRFAHATNRYLRGPTVNAGLIRGGDKVNIVADWCEFELDVRFLPGMSAQDLKEAIRRIVRRRAPEFRLEVTGVQQPYTIDVKHPLVAGLRKAIRGAGARPHVCGSEGATVITFFQHYGIPAVAAGFGARGCAHKADEYVEVPALVRGAGILESFLKEFAF